MSKSLNIRTLSVSIIYLTLFRISSVYFPDLESATYLLPTNSIYFLFNFFSKYLTISLPLFPSDISIKYLLLGSFTFFSMASKTEKLLFKLTVSSNFLYLLLKISKIFMLVSSIPPKFLFRDWIPISVKIFLRCLANWSFFEINSLIAVFIKL